MIPIGVEQRLGQRSFFILALSYCAPAFGVLIAAAAVIALNGRILRLFASIADVSGSSFDPSALSAYLSWFIVALLALAVLFFLCGLIIAWLIYTHYTFTIQEFDLRLKRGIIDIKEITIPFRQMQNVNLDRGIFYRLLGVSKVIIDSAGHEDYREQNITNISLEPIEKNLAREIQDLLERKIGVQVVESEREADREFPAMPATDRG
jgi:uncharacterized membrane protein YdbT with pleckstrin-like domain